MEFYRIDNAKKRSSAVADQILDAVRRGAYKQGSKLPPERTLARLMGVSRNSVREAISALQVAGFVNTKVGDGSYVAQGPPPPKLQGVPTPSSNSVGLLGIWLARNEIEQILLQLALEKGTKADIEELKVILSDMSTAIAEGSSPKYSLSDVAFHLRIADLSNNFPLVRAERQLLNISRQFYRVLDYSETPRSQRHLVSSLAIHRSIVDAIENRDVLAALRTQKEHFQMVIDYLETVFEMDCEFDFSPLAESQFEMEMLE